MTILQRKDELYAERRLHVPTAGLAGANFGTSISPPP